jgi:hypothetical protein
MLPQRRCSMNSGGGIAPAAIWGLIEGASGTVNAFQPSQKPGNGDGTVRKPLMRLNFRDAPGIG